MRRFLALAVGCGAIVGLSGCGQSSAGSPACTYAVTGAIADPTGQADYLLDMGAGLVDGATPGELTVTAPARRPIELEARPVAGAFRTETTEARSLAAGEQAVVGWSFRPGDVGAASAVAEVHTSCGDFTVRLAGEGFEPHLSCDPAAVDFGEVWRIGEGRREVVCTNTAGHPWELAANGVIEGEDGDLFSLGPITAGPAPGSWRFEVSVTDPRPGLRSATLRLWAAEGAHGFSLPVRVTGLTQALECTPAAIDFGYVAPDTVTHRELVCVNGGGAPITITSVGLEAASSPNVFAWSPSDYPIVVPARTGEADGRVVIDVVIAPRPTDAGRRLTGTLVIETDEPSRPRLEIGLNHAVGGPALGCDTGPIDFGPVAVGLPVTRSLTCGNYGTEDPTRTDGALVIAGFETPAEFHAEVRGGARPEGYRPGETFTVDVTYAPTDDGPDAGAVRLLSNSMYGPREVAVSGEGLDLPACEFTLAPASLRFGLVERGREGTLEFAIRNRSDGACLIRDLRLAATCDPAFSLPDGAFDAEVLAAGAERRVPVKFQPTAPGATSSSCEVLFDLSSPASPHGVVPLTGTSVESCVVVDPDYVDFGQARAGCGNGLREIAIYNYCSEPLILGSLEVVAGASDEFSIAGYPPPGITIGQGRSAIFPLAYVPQDEGVDLGGIHVFVYGVAEPYLVTLRGSMGTDPTHVDVFGPEKTDGVDVLFVVDNSASLADERAAIASHADTFLAPARAAGIDFHVGVTTSSLVAAGACPGGVNGGEDGRLFPVDGSRPRFLTPTTPAANAVWQGNFDVGSCGAGGLSLEAAFRALAAPVGTSCDDPRHPEDDDGNCGFLRRDARLEIVAVTDALQRSPGTVDFYNAAFQALKGYRNPDLVGFHTITGDWGTGCTSAGGAAAPGDPLIALVGLRPGGLFRSICTTDWEATLAELSAAVFRPRRACFPLQGWPEDTNGNGTVSDLEGELVVRLNGVVTASTGPEGLRWRHVRDTNEICFEPHAEPEYGTRVEVQYRVACLAR